MRSYVYHRVSGSARLLSEASQCTDALVQPILELTASLQLCMQEVSNENCVAGLKRPRLGAQPLRLRKTTSGRERGGVAVWNPSLDPPRPPHADALDSVEEILSPRGDNDEGADDSRPGATSAESLASMAATFLPAELQNTPANQPPHAASIQMAVNNCHMLQYRASRPIDASAPGTQKDLELIASESPSDTLGTGAARKGMVAKRSFRSVMPAKLSSKVQPALVTVTAGQ